MDVTLFILGLLLLPAVLQVSGCDRGWFGSKCQFKCRCTNVGCDTTGLCTAGERCLAGWFGPACQYEDVAYQRSNITEVTDEDDDTCVDAVTVRRIFIGLFFPLSWMRVHFLIPGVLDKLKFRMRGLHSVIKCPITRMAAVDNLTLDVHCPDSPYVHEVILFGIGAHYVCSVFMTGGRNVAIKQTANQTSTYSENSSATGHHVWSFPAELAVDGNRNQNLYEGSGCANTEEYSPTRGVFIVKLSPPCVVNKYLVYNRWDAAPFRLKGFTLESFNENGLLVFQYRDKFPIALRVYKIAHEDEIVALVRITTTHTQTMLTLCEVEVYGEYVCPPGRYGLECEKTCNCMFEDDCFKSTGGCPSGCANGYFGGDCGTPCAEDTYGPSCNMYCSPFCVRDSNESEPTCSHVHGECFFGCDIGYEGPFCDVACAPNTYGKDCQFHCSTGCLPSRDSSDTSCHHITGDCVNGCPSGYEGTFCNTTCAPHTYGENCGFSCSQRCLPSNDSSKSSCNHLTGICLFDCIEGYNGTSCTESVTDEKESFIEPDTGHADVIVALSAVVALGTVGAIIAVVFCVRKKENLKSDEGSEYTT